MKTASPARNPTVVVSLLQPVILLAAIMFLDNPVDKNKQLGDTTRQKEGNKLTQH
jgi:hypothetical protein